MGNNHQISSADIKKIENDFKKEVETILDIAKKSPKGGGEEWHSLLKKHSIEPLPADLRKDVEMQIPGMTSGAFPFEVRMVFQKVLADAEAKIKELDGFQYIHDDFNLHDALYELKFYFSNRFDINFEINKYYSMIKAPVTLNNIFANASMGMNMYSSGLKDSRTGTIRCKSCGAPRLKENQYDLCFYCGSNLFSKNQQI